MNRISGSNKLKSNSLRFSSRYIFGKLLRCIIIICVSLVINFENGWIPCLNLNVREIRSKYPLRSHLNRMNEWHWFEHYLFSISSNRVYWLNLKSHSELISRRLNICVNFENQMCTLEPNQKPIGVHFASQNQPLSYIDVLCTCKKPQIHISSASEWLMQTQPNQYVLINTQFNMY